MNVWKIRREGSPISSSDLTFDQVMQSLLDGKIHLNDEVKGPTDADWMKVEDHPAFAETAADMEPEPERRVEEETRLDMNALIDVSLVLLIFFILTTTYATLQKVIEAAEASEETTSKGLRVVKDTEVNETMIQVAVKYNEKDKKSTIFVEQKEVAPDNVMAELKKTSSPKRRTLLLQHHDKVPHGVIVGIQDAAKTAGLERVLLVAPEKK